jgi:hypothetical protein
MSDKAIARALLELPEPARTAAFLELFDGRFARTPHDRVLAWYRETKRAAFLDRASRCPLLEQARICQELIKGTDPDEVLNGMSARPDPTKERP